MMEKKGLCWDGRVGWLHAGSGEQNCAGRGDLEGERIFVLRRGIWGG